MFEALGIFLAVGWVLTTVMQFGTFLSDRHNRQSMCEELLRYVQVCHFEVTHCRQACKWWLIPVPFSYPRPTYWLGHRGLWAELPSELPLADAAKIAACALNAMLRSGLFAGDLDAEEAYRYPDED